MIHAPGQHLLGISQNQWQVVGIIGQVNEFIRILLKIEK